MNKILLLGTMLAFTSSLALADKPVAENPDERAKAEQLLSSFVEQTTSWQADFEQQVSDPDGRITDTSTGVFLLQRPDRFRWEYRTPWLQTIVADGDRLQMYDVDLEQVTVRAMNGSLNSTPAALLAGDGSALDAFVVTDVVESDGELWLQLVPNDDSGDFERVRIGFAGSQLVALQLVDRLAQTTTINFSNIRSNISISEDSFRLELPEGVDVIDESAF